MSTAPLQVTTLPALKTFLQIPDGDKSEDKALLQLIARCDQTVKTWLRVTSWQPATDDISFYNGNNTQVIRLRQKPVVSITNVWEDPNACAGQGPNDFGTGTLLTAGVNYYLPWDMPNGQNASWTGRLVKLNSVWEPQWRYYSGLLTPTIAQSNGTIKVEYVYGWPDGIPLDITQAAENMIAAFRAGAQYGKSLSSFSFKGFSPNFSQSAQGFFTQECKDNLATYRRLLN